MKKRWLILTAVVLLGFLTACGTNDDKSEDTPPSITEPATATFEGTIEEINGQSALISIEDGQILSSGILVVQGRSTEDFLFIFESW